MYAIRSYYVIFVPKYILYPIIIVMCTVGAYAINYGVMFDVWTLLIFGLLAWAGCKLKLQIPPLLINNDFKHRSLEFGTIYIGDGDNEHDVITSYSIHYTKLYEA